MCTAEWSYLSSVCTYMNSHTSEILNKPKLFVLCICIILCWFFLVLNRLKLLLILSFFFLTLFLWYWERRPGNKILSCVSALETGDGDRSGQAQALADAFMEPWENIWSLETVASQLYVIQKCILIYTGDWLRLSLLVSYSSCQHQNQRILFQ